MIGQDTFSFNLMTKIGIGIVIIVLMPLILLGALSYSSATQLSLQNVESFIAESGVRRQQAIANNFQSAVTTINAFLDVANNRSALIEPLIIRLQRGTSAESRSLENTVENLFERELLTSPYFNSVWVLTPQGIAFSTASNENLPETLELQRASTSEIFRVGQRLLTDSSDTLTIVSTEVNGVPHLELINLLFSVVNEELTFVGYLVADLNLDEIIVTNLARQEGQLTTYAYLVLPNNTTYIASSDTNNAGLVDLNSVGAQRILRGEASNVDSYEVGPPEARRQVIGHYTSLEISDQRFSLVTEINADIIQRQIFTYIATISFPVTIGTLVLLGLGIILISQLILPSVNQLREALLAMMRGNYDAPITFTNRSDEIGSLGTSFVDMRNYVRELTDDMNRRLRERTRDVRITQDISRSMTAERDLNQLMNRVVDLIIENFPAIYHAQIFLNDSNHEYAVLRASTGEAGRNLLARGHRLAIGSVSVIGQVTEQGQVVIARDTTDSDVHRRNEFLRETRAELAIPLRLGDEIIGALDVQSKQRDSFDSDQVTALQTLADQITIAIENARLYAESERLLKDIEQERRATTRQAWRQYISAQRTNEVVMRSGVDTGHDFSDIVKAVYRSGKPIVGNVTNRNTIPFAVPVRLRGETLGVVEYEVQKADFTYDKVLLAEELVSRLSISLENARLFQDSQQATQRERLVNEISTKLTGQTDIEQIIQTAIREVGVALRTPQVAIRLKMNESSSNGNGSHTMNDAVETHET